MSTVVLRNAEIINEGRRLRADVLLRDGRIERIGTIPAGTKADQEYDLTGKLLLPGLIDDQVHFREPGLTHKACIASEARAAVAGGVTSFMEMPNTNPPATTHAELEKKYAIGAATPVANYSFYFGATNSNVEAIKAKTQTLAQASMKLGEAMYQAQAGGSPDGDEQAETADDGVVDAEFEEVDDDKKSA